MITLHIVGTPRPQPRARFVGRGAARRVVSTANRQAKQWRNRVMAAARRALEAHGPQAGAVELVAAFYFETPDAGRWGKPHTARPDADNLLKLVMDAIESAGLLPKGDAAIARTITSKAWAAQPGVVVTMGPSEALAAGDDPDDLGVAFIAAQPRAPV